MVQARQAFSDQVVPYAVGSTADFLTCVDRLKLSGESSSVLACEAMCQFAGEYTGNVVLASRFDVRVYALALKAEAETVRPETPPEPEPEPAKATGHLTFRGVAMEPTTKTITLTGTHTSEEYVFESGLPFISGPPGVVSVPAYQSVEVDLVVQVQRAGTARGAVYFHPTSVERDQETDPDHLDPSTLWYTCDVLVEPAAALDDIELETRTGQAVVSSVDVSNPLNQAVEIEVILEGIDVLGDRMLLLGPGESFSYEVIFSPLAPGVSDGRLVFTSPQLGDHQYNLHLVSTEPEEEVLAPVSASVGASSTATYTIENPLNEDMDFEVILTNSVAFSCSPSRIAVPAFSTETLSVVYQPTSVGQEETTGVRLEGVPSRFRGPPRILKLLSLTGVGSRPAPLEETLITCQPGSAVTKALTFKNPFLYPVTVGIELLAEPGPLRLGRAQTNARKLRTLAACETMQVSLVFEPASMVTVSGQCRVTATLLRDGRASADAETEDEGVVWTYPIRAVAELVKSGLPEVVRSLTHAIRVVTLDLSLAGLNKALMADVVAATKGAGAAPALVTKSTMDSRPSPSAAEPQSLLVSLDLDLGPETQAVKQCVSLKRVQATLPLSVEHEAAVAQGLSVALMPSGPIEQEGILSASETLSVPISFEPRRPVSVFGSLLVERSPAGGRWRFPIRLEAGLPKPEGVVVVEAASPGSVGTARVVAQNRSDGYSQYRAYFMAESGFQFGVDPCEGILNPRSSRPTELTVSFAPKSFSGLSSGRLVVETRDDLWIWEVRGRFASYKPPRVRAKVDAVMPRQTVRALAGVGGGGKGKKAPNYLQLNALNATRSKSQRAREREREERR
ncbi:hypothetical protein KIPB_004097 [Kipferlia bialata]|nr:hypothetical protein KIPB_004097 [Kipferlia bialata]|eukprot:g4097.t1